MDNIYFKIYNEHLHLFHDKIKDFVKQSNGMLLEKKYDDHIGFDVEFSSNEDREAFMQFLSENKMDFSGSAGY